MPVRNFGIQRFFNYVIVLTLALITSSLAKADQQTVLLVSIDGFRWDFFDKTPAPNLNRLAAQGVQAKALIPVFPTETFPSHYSMLTGLHPERHGIVGNKMQDPAISKPFNLRDRESLQNTNWWLGEPIWITAQRQGLKSATCFWPGTDVVIAGGRPTYWLPFDNNMPNEKRLSQICDWLALPSIKRPQFLTLYLGEVDKAGHRYGPDSIQVAAAIRETDRVIGVLMEKLNAFKNLNLNVIIVSDHGMSAISHDRVIALDDYLNMEEVSKSKGGELVFIYPRPGREDSVFQQLKRMPHAKFYRREEVPERLHFRNSPRIAPIVGITEDGWMIFGRAAIPEWKAANSRGTHGYDNLYPSMHGIFIASGPAFKSGLTVEPFLNLHLYELAAKILGIKPAPNQGEFQVVKPMLKNHGAEK